MHRQKHFMKVDMLDSQFEALEEPSDAIVVDIALPSSAIVAQILARSRKPPPTLQNGAAPQDVEKKRAVG
jgi:gluconate kinase